MKKLKKNVKNFIKYMIKYFYTNRLFISYLVLSVTGTIILRIVTINSDDFFNPFITDLGLIFLIGSFGYFVKPKNQYRYFMIWIIFFSSIEIINSIYYTFYSSFSSLAELATLKQARAVSDSVFTELRLIDFIYILEPVIFYYIHKKLKKSMYYSVMGKIENKRKCFISNIIVSILLLIISFGTATGTDYSRLAKQWNRNYIVERFGIIVYQFNDAFLTLKPKISSMFGRDEALYRFNNFFDEKEKNTTKTKNKYTGLLEGYNIVYIHMESMQNFLMDLEFNGTKVTPNLNRLAKEGMFFENFYSPVSTGTSSDAEYMVLTGLLPSSSGTVFVTYADNTFNSIAKELQKRGYYTFSMHGNQASMWNRSKVHPRLGYDNMFFKESYEFTDDDVIGLGINDKLFFKQSLEKLETIEKENENYFGTIITLTNHSPFVNNDAFTLDLKGKDSEECYLCERTIGRYIVSSHYADEALGEFIDYVKKSDSFNNTLFVFYGDHDAKLSYKDMNYLYNYDHLTGDLKKEDDPSYKEYTIFDHYLHKKVPLIMWSKNKKISQKLKGNVSYTMSMYDVIPTLYNMLKIDNKYLFGYDIFTIKNDNFVIFPNGNYVTDKVYYNNSTGEYKILKNVALNKEYVNNYANMAEEILEISNSLLTYNLLKEDKKSEL